MGMFFFLAGANVKATNVMTSHSDIRCFELPATHKTKETTQHFEFLSNDCPYDSRTSARTWEGIIKQLNLGLPGCQLTKNCDLGRRFVEVGEDADVLEERFGPIRTSWAVCLYLICIGAYLAFLLFDVPALPEVDAFPIKVCSALPQPHF